MLAEFISSCSKKIGSHPNDVCVLSLSIETIREIDFHFRKVSKEKSYIMAETKEFYNHLKEKYSQTKKLDHELEKIRKNKNFIFG